MSKRKITHQQQRRIAVKQNTREDRSDAPAIEEDSLQSLGPEQSGWLISRFGKNVEVEDETGRTYACHMRQHLPIPVCGDRVIWRQGHDEKGVVVAIEERQTQLVRCDRQGALKPMAANITQMLIVIAPVPPTGFLQLDKLLIAAGQLGIAPAIVINKGDLPEAKTLYQETIALYGHFNCPILLASAKKSHGLDALTACLEDHTNIFVGQSGVGKSSLIKALIPQHDISIGDLSLQSGLGTHTTTAARLYHLSAHSHLIDSPGIRQFSLWPIDFLQLLSGYPEFLPYLDHCQFRNCQHLNESQCAVKQAVMEEKIPLPRYENYLELLQTIE